MYMADARDLRHLRDTNMLLFLALGNAKVLYFASGDAKVPNANVFASQWNIGLTQMKCTCNTNDSTYILYESIIKIR